MFFKLKNASYPVVKIEPFTGADIVALIIVIYTECCMVKVRG